MKTFITSSVLAVLSAVVFTVVMVKTGGEVPRRSPESYPPMVSGPVVENEVAEIVAVEPEVEAVLETVAEAQVEPEGSDPVASAETPPKKVARRIVNEPYGPPAPVLPFVLNINAAEEGVSMQGSIPTREIKAAISEAIAKAFEDESVDNRLKFSPETRSGLWISYLPDFIGRYFQYTGGNHELTIVDGKLILAGAVASKEAKKSLLQWAKPLKKYGLVLEEQVDVDESLKGKVEEIPETVVATMPVKVSPPEEEVIEVAALIDSENQSLKSTGEMVPEAEEGIEADPESLVFVAPFDEQYGIHTVPDLRAEAGESEETVIVPESSPVVDQEPSGPSAASESGENPFVDDGGPLIFYFDSPAA